MGWGNGLILAGLLFVGVIGWVLHIEAKRQNRQFVSNKRLNQYAPRCFQVGKDVK